METNWPEAMSSTARVASTGLPVIEANNGGGSACIFSSTRRTNSPMLIEPSTLIRAFSSAVRKRLSITRWISSLPP